MGGADFPADVDAAAIGQLWHRAGRHHAAAGMRRKASVAVAASPTMTRSSAAVEAVSQPPNQLVIIKNEDSVGLTLVTSEAGSTIADADPIRSSV